MSRRDYFKEENKYKKITIVFSVTLLLTIVTFILLFNMYNKNLREEAQRNLLELGSINAVVPNNTTENAKPASISNDKGINEVSNEIIKKHKTEEIKNETVVVSKTSTNEVNQNNQEQEVQEPEPSIIEENPKKELVFSAPVSGDIMKDFATETLVYSKTLDEWTTHDGIDIRADKTTVVLASEAGIIESIKNDPRYGLTVTISHNDGFKTIYSNLLVADFVTEGETVEKGQTIGTVGESSSFEISDETHLHFEMTKDGEYVNPTIYLK